MGEHTEVSRSKIPQNSLHAAARCGQQAQHKNPAPLHQNSKSAPCLTKRRLVSRILVLVNVTTLFVHLPTKHATAASVTSGAPAKQPTAINKSQQQHQRLAQQMQDQTANQSQSEAAPSSSSLETSALNYLQKYGYMSSANTEANNHLISEDSFSSAIAQFQRFAGIPETGLVDNQTLRFMQMPRCGNADQALPGSPARQQAGHKLRSALLSIDTSGLRRRRRKRYALQGSKWRRQELTYRISQYPTRFSGKRHEVDAQIEKAFGIWSQVAPIEFVVKREGRVHIDIRFASGDHGDGDAFDGPGNTLAHAYFPQYGGDAHFDDQEYWTVDSYAGTNIFQVAAHELGHSLGLGHSNVREALMAPFYQKYKPNFKLHIDDVLAIQALYGEKPISGSSADDLFPASFTSTSTSTSTSRPATSSTSTTTTTSAPSTTTQRPTTKHPYLGTRTRPGIFFGAKPDSRETNDGDEENQVGVGSTSTLPDLTPVGGNGIGPSGAADESSGTASYPADLCFDSAIDAVTRTEDGNSYVFKGDFYWLLTSEGLAKGYPRKIGSDWDGLPGSLDAALTWADGKTFFFKGNKYWRYRNKRRDIGYPKLISAGFAGIPDDIDAAFVWSGNGRTYIFKGTEYWRFDSKADPPVSSEYPRSIKVWNGVPSYINAAFKWENNVTYFFKGNQYYRFNDKEFKTESRGRPPFPRQSAEWWFGCVNSNLAHQRASSSLREQNNAESYLQPKQDYGNSDWSFFAGDQEATVNRHLGTHINDHKPGSFQTTTSDGGSSMHVDIAARSSETSPQNTLHSGHRIGLFNPAHATTSTTASSSAISLAQHLNLSAGLHYTQLGMLLLLLSLSTRLTFNFCLT